MERPPPSVHPHRPEPCTWMCMEPPSWMRLASPAAHSHPWSTQHMELSSQKTASIGLHCHQYAWNGQPESVHLHRREPCTVTSQGAWNHPECTQRPVEFKEGIRKSGFVQCVSRNRDRRNTVFYIGGGKLLVGTCGVSTRSEKPGHFRRFFPVRENGHFGQILEKQGKLKIFLEASGKKKRMGEGYLLVLFVSQMPKEENLLLSENFSSFLVWTVIHLAFDPDCTHTSRRRCTSMYMCM